MRAGPSARGLALPGLLVTQTAPAGNPAAPAARGQPPAMPKPLQWHRSQCAACERGLHAYRKQMYEERCF